MQEVITKINELHSVLELKIANCDKRAIALTAQKRGMEGMLDKQRAVMNLMNAKKRVLEKNEVTQQDVLNVRKLKVAVSEQRVEQDALQVELNKRDAEIVKKEKYVETMSALFIKKNGNMDALKKELELERKLMKEKVLEELKGKL